MSYTLPASWSLESMRDYVWAVEAGLEADPALAALAPPWAAFENALEAERLKRDGVRKRLVKRSAVQRVADLRWDNVIKRLGTRSFADAERDAKRPPYVLLFGTLPPSQCRRLGAVKAGELSNGLIAKLRELGPDYASFEAELSQAAAALRDADQQRKQLQAEDGGHDLRRRALLEDLEALVDTTELGILTARPGDNDAVRAVLSPWKDATRVNRDEAGGPPDAPPAS